MEVKLVCNSRQGHLTANQEVLNGCSGIFCSKAGCWLDHLIITQPLDEEALPAI